MAEEKTIKYYFFKDNLRIEKIVDDYYNYIQTIITNSTNASEEDKEEIISDVFLVIWKNRNLLDKKALLSPYIVGITKRIIYKKYKKSLIYNSLINIDENEFEIPNSFNVEKIIENKEMNDVIIKNLENLGKIESEIFTKFYFEDKAIKQIAKELNLTKSNVKVKLHRTRKKIKELLKMGGF